MITDKRVKYALKEMNDAQNSFLKFSDSISRELTEKEKAEDHNIGNSFGSSFEQQSHRSIIEFKTIEDFDKYKKLEEKMLETRKTFKKEYDLYLLQQNRLKKLNRILNKK